MKDLKHLIYFEDLLENADNELVEQAKAILMKQLHLTEPEAHHLLQKQAMDHSVKMAEYAARIVAEEKPKQG